MAVPFGSSSTQPVPARSRMKPLARLLARFTRSLLRRRPRQRARLQFEQLEPRLLLSADAVPVSFQMDETSNELTVRLVDEAGVEMLQLLDEDASDPSTRVVASWDLAGTGALTIFGTAFDDALTVDGSLAPGVDLRFLDASGDDEDSLRLRGTDATWQISGAGSGTVESLQFGQIENLIGLVRQLCKNVRRWRDVRMVKRWTVSAMIEAKKGMRRLRGYRSLPILQAALRRHQQDVLAEIDQKAKAA